MKYDLSDIVSGIYKCDNQDDLRIISDAVKNHWKTLTSRSADKFNVGDKVVFRSSRTGTIIQGIVVRSSRTGTIIQGIVVRINRVSVAVQQAKDSTWTGVPLVWRVSPSLLRKAQAGAI